MVLDRRVEKLYVCVKRRLASFSPTIFYDSHLFMKRLTLVSIDMHLSKFKFCQILVELFIFEIQKYQLPAVNDSGE
jgi:hypothetical protein